MAGAVWDYEEPHLSALPGASPKRRKKWEERQEQPSDRVEKGSLERSLISAVSNSGTAINTSQISLPTSHPSTGHSGKPPMELVGPQ